jgi:hypothetical protein
MALSEIYVDPAIAADSGDGLDLLGLSLPNASYDHTGDGEGERHLSLAPVRLRTLPVIISHLSIPGMLKKVHVPLHSVTE